MACKKISAKTQAGTESLSFIYKIAHLHNLGTLTVTPFALHDVRTASLLCLPHPQRNSNSSKCTTSRVTLATADAQDSPHRAHVHTHTRTSAPQGRHTTFCYKHPHCDQDLVGQSRTSGLLQPKGGKRASQNIDGACRLCQPSVPKGIKQACQTEHKGAGEINSTIKKGFQKFYSSRTNIFFPTGSKIPDFIRIVISRQVDFKPGLKFPFQFFKAKLKAQQKKFKPFQDLKSKAYKTNVVQNEGK